MTDRITGTKQGPPDYGLDELWMRSVDVHIERLASGHLFIGIYPVGQPAGQARRVAVYLHSQRKITAAIEDERLPSHVPATPPEDQ